MLFGKKRVNILLYLTMHEKPNSLFFFFLSISVWYGPRPLTSLKSCSQCHRIVLFYLHTLNGHNQIWQLFVLSEERESNRFPLTHKKINMKNNTPYHICCYFMIHMDKFIRGKVKIEVQSTITIIIIFVACVLQFCQSNK